MIKDIFIDIMIYRSIYYTFFAANLESQYHARRANRSMAVWTSTIAGRTKVPVGC